MEKKSVDFQLSETLEYSHKGEFEKTATIIMHSPSMEVSMDVFDQVSNLSQLVLGAVSEAQERNIGKREDFKELIEEARKAKEDKKEEEISSFEVRAMLLTSQRIKFTKIAGEFKKLAPSVCEVAEGVKLVPNIIKKLSIDDYTNLICSYIANFITPSLL